MPAASECRSMGSGKESVDVIFACMEAEEFFALPRIATGRFEIGEGSGRVCLGKHNANKHIRP